MKLITPPAQLPIDLETAKAHLRVDHTDEDTVIEALIGAATDWVEKFTGRALVSQVWDQYLGEFPDSGAIELKKPPLIEVVGVFYTSGSESEFTDFSVDGSEPASVFIPSSGSWPTADVQSNAIRIRFRSGYIDPGNSPPGELPGSLTAALLIYLGQLYQYREFSVEGHITQAHPWGAEQLLRQYRVEKGMA